MIILGIKVCSLDFLNNNMLEKHCHIITSNKTRKWAGYDAIK